MDESVNTTINTLTESQVTVDNSMIMYLIDREEMTLDYRAK